MANKRLIDVANAISHYKALANIALNEKVSPVSWKEAFEDFIAYLKDAPTVDAVEVVHGEWDVITDDCTFDVIYQCSVCKEEFVTNDGTPAENLWHYCPNCGAKMDGGNEE